MTQISYHEGINSLMHGYYLMTGTGMPREALQTLQTRQVEAWISEGLTTISTASSVAEGYNQIQRLLGNDLTIDINYDRIGL